MGPNEALFHLVLNVGKEEGMPKRKPEMPAVAVRRLTTPGRHTVGGVPGLSLAISDTGARSWNLRVTIAGRRRDIGLGSADEVSLSAARAKAREIRDAVREGRDPIAERAARKDALRAAEASRITFDDAARRYLAAKRTEFKNPKHAQQWENTLATYASPTLGNLPVDQIETAHIVRVLEPIWNGKTETAQRLRGRIEKVLAWATTSGFRHGDNPARWRGHLDTILPTPSKVHTVRHFRALPFPEVATFMRDLRAREGIAARALDFLILTAARSGEVRGATWDEIDLDGRTWTIPAERMKARKAHRVPLSEDAVALLQNLPRHAGSSYVFTAPRGGKLSDATMSAVLRRMDVDATVHGFRSSFRDWAAERTSYPHEVIEQSLAHTISNAVERAYRRGDLLAKRAQLMEQWATFCATVEPSGTVHSIQEGQR